ncbi:isochorismate synthase [Pseudoalteromonas sp. R3]|uniref:isochorismate synthase n=1 Tax=Pseudoalteromonas sp. R3 TaxID=1709477 RepID=UPI0006B5342B|nr:isochorismate synthase [Pseudoalteromonas sp. R3]AZZ99748.1 isochorismate synthase [Pseudoalteromonas sp. R3]
MHAGHLSDVPQALELGEFRPEQDCLFVSGQNCLVSRGVARRFTLPISDTDNLANQLQQALNNAAQTSQSQAIAFGVVPFCKQQQAQFIIPEQVSTLDKHLFAQCLSAQHTCAQTPNRLQSVHYKQDRAHFEQTVRDAKTLFADGELDKIVLSKQVELQFEQPLDQVGVLSQLLAQSPSGYHFSIPSQLHDAHAQCDAGVLMGVSPELLLRKSDGQIFSNPLAGSIPRDPCPSVEAQRRSTLFASKKDRYEHAVVLQDMAQILGPLCSKLHIPEQPDLLSTATMWHLSTVIEGTLTDPRQPAIALANRLHPTPALCGKPTELAYQHIDALEGHGRGLFSGIVGWCDNQGNGEWVVVIRCGYLQANLATLFAGAGIVAASDPSSEWLETEAKLNTMLNALDVRHAYHLATKHTL